jgi:hypothetical protein
MWMVSNDIDQLYYMHQLFLVFFLNFDKFWPDDDLFRPEMVANIWNNKIKYIFDWKSKYMYMYLYVFFIPFYFLALHISGAICTHHQEHNLQSTAIGMCNDYSMLIQWNRYWLGHPHTVSKVRCTWLC